MEEQKDQQNAQSTNINTPGSSEQDFSSTNNLKLNDLETPAPTESLISQANLQEETKAPREEVKIENLGMRIQPTEDGVAKTSLGESGIVGGKKSKYHSQYRRLFLISFFIILVTGLASIILRLYSRYIYFASQPVSDATYQTYINTYKQ